MSGKCGDCEFCFPHPQYSFVCADVHYDQNISNSLEEVKDCYTEGFDTFVTRCEEEAIIFDEGTKLIELKIDGRKNIELLDQKNKIISIKASVAKKMFPEIQVYKQKFDYQYEVLAIFDEKPFQGSRLLVIN